jgi:oligosaccharyl transferase (archaeosortase A-associated)
MAIITKGLLMDLQDFSKYQKPLIVVLLGIITLVALWMRLLPQADMVSDAWVNLLGNDPWYTLRQVEQTVVQFPAYGWFDAMTEYPVGNTVHWGPLFVQIISLLSILAGASTRPEIMYVASWVPPLMGAAMVPLMYVTGKKMADWKTGLLAALFIAVVSGQYFYRSLFGFVDHHIAEVLFSTLFAFAYLSVLVYAKTNPVDLKTVQTLKKPLILSAFAGIAYLLGLFVMPTMILFALIVAVYTPIQFVYDHFRNRSSEDVLLLNIVVFSMAVLGLLLFGIQHPDTTSLSRYSIGHIYAYLAIIIATVLLYGISVRLKGKPKYYYPLALGGAGIAGALLLALVSPDLYGVLIGSFGAFFGQSATVLTVQEARPWTFADAWSTFHYGLIMMILGAGALLYANLREEHPEQVFVLVWSVVILFSTISHIRYEYYLGVTVALLSAFFIGFVLDRGAADIAGLLGGDRRRTEPTEKPENPKRKGKSERKVKAPDHRPATVVLVVAVVCFILALLFVVSSVTTDLAVGTSVGKSGMNGDWRESLEWMQDHTAATGVDYYAIYDAATYQYPPESYGVMSWWDYGHWITFVAQRIPNANPFQHGVAGPNGAAAFFVQQSEEDSSAILDTLNTRYVVTDIEMDFSKFWAMATWYNSSGGEAPFRMQLLNRVGEYQYEPVSLFTSAYYHTMISRLHNFDGSMIEPGEVFYVEYTDGGASGSSLPVITGGKKMEPDAAEEAVRQYNAAASATKHAAVLSSDLLTPTDSVPALQHYRLVHESPSNVLSGGTRDLKYVKVFEYVPGARIRGEGIISVELVTNTGRTFTYRQESVQGVFTVPYSTAGSPSDVSAQGKYRIEGTDLEFDVSEEAVQQGLFIN